MYMQPYMKAPDFPNNQELLDAWATQWAHLASLRGPAVVLGAAPPGSWHSRSIFGTRPRTELRLVQTEAALKHVAVAAVVTCVA